MYDRGAYILSRKRVDDAVITDDLYLIGNKDAALLQKASDTDSKDIGVAENTVIIKSAVSDMLLHKAVDRRLRFRVSDKHALIVDTLYIAFALKAHIALIGFARDFGAGTQKQQLAAAQFDELLRGEFATAEVVRGYAGDHLAQMSVNGHDGDRAVRFKVRIVGEGDYAVSLIVFYHSKALIFCFTVGIRDHQDSPIPLARQTLNELIGQICKKRMLIVHIRDAVYELDAPNNETLITALERAGIGVYPVAQLFDRFLYFSPTVFSDRQIVDHLGNGGKRKTAFLCNVFDSRGGMGVHFSLRNKRVSGICR